MMDPSAQKTVYSDLKSDALEVWEGVLSEWIPSRPFLALSLVGMH